MTSIRIGLGIGIRSMAFSPNTLFSAGEKGAIYDPRAMASLSQDSAGTTPVTAVAQPVGRVADQSGNAAHALQATAGLRTLYARVPQGGRRNMLPNNANTGLAVGVIGSGGALPTGWSSGATLTRQIIGSGTSDGVPYFDIRLTGTLSGNFFIDMSSNMSIVADAGEVWLASAYVQAIGTVTGASALILVPSTRLTNGNIKHTYPSVSIGFPGALTRFSAPAATLSDADGAVGDVAWIMPYLRLSCTGTVDVTLRIGGSQLERASAASALQVVASAADITEAGKANRFAILDDQVDDAMATTLPAGTYTVAYGSDTAVTILTGQAISGAWTIPGPDRMYGLVAINRALTATETASVTAWVNERRP